MSHEIILNDEVYRKIIDKCLAFYDSGESNVFTMQQDVMDMPEIPMHYPYHHFIVPAVLLTAASLCSGWDRGDLTAALDTACERAKNVLGGFCGFYGACGAGVGVGIFYSVFTGTTPVSGDSWAQANHATSEALLKISEVSGPRCCKRCSFMALYSAAESVSRDFGFEFAVTDNIKCRYSHRNLDCKGPECPFFQGDEQ